MTDKQTYSRNGRAEKLVGLREVTEGMVIFNVPGELGYQCPVCKNEIYDERLGWSEYNYFLWCSVCNKDYPSVLCQPDIDKATDIFLKCIEEAMAIKQGGEILEN